MKPAYLDEPTQKTAYELRIEENIAKYQDQLRETANKCQRSDIYASLRYWNREMRKIKGE